MIPRNEKDAHFSRFFHVKKENAKFN